MNNKYIHFLDSLAIYALWTAAVFDPVGTLGGGRYVALGLVYFVLFIRFVRCDLMLRVDGFYLWIFCFFVLFLPEYGLVVGLLRGGFEAQFVDTAYLGAAVLFACSLIYLKNNLIQIGLKSLVFSLRLLCIIIILCLLSLVAKIELDWMYFFVENGVAFIGERSYGGFGFYYIYFIASPMVIYLMAYEVWRYSDRPSLRGFLFSSLPVAALFLSGTRVNMLMAVFGAPLVFLWRRLGVYSIFFQFLIGLIVYICLRVLGIDIIESMFDANEYSNAIKISFLGGYQDIFSDPMAIIFGQGFNAHAWSQSFIDMLPGGADGGASRTELTYLEFFRVFGFFVGFAFIATVLLIIKKLDGLDPMWRWLGVAMFLYMGASSLNPYIFSSNGILPLGLCAAVLHRFRISVPLRDSEKLASVA